MLSVITGLSAAELISKGKSKLTKKQARRLENFVERRVAGEPLQYILGEASFRNLSFKVDRRVLIPRPETELIVDVVIRLLPPGGRVLEVGIGSGCIGLSIKSERPDSNVIGVDISDGALQVARSNASELGLDVEVRQSDVFDDRFGNSMGKFDLIVSNPPYIPADEMLILESVVRDFEPSLALEADEDGLAFYTRLAELSKTMLNDGGHLVTEIHTPKSREVVLVFEAADLRDVSVEKDLAQRDRIVIGRVVNPRTL